MPSILFWNLDNKDLTSEICSLCNEHQVDILILSECNLNLIKLQLLLNETRHGKSVYLNPFNPSPRIQFLIKYPLSSLTIVHDSEYLSIRKISPPIGQEFLLAAVHLSSKLYYSSTDQLLSATRVIERIEEAEAQEGHDRTLIIGDFNMNPFEDGMVAAEAFHAVMDRRIAAKKHRMVQNLHKKMFYNPMWSRMGDTSLGPPGTYFLNKSGYVNLYWHTFDQILIRPDLLQFFNDENLKVITECDSQSLLKEFRLDSKSFSDHLPIFFKLQIEEAISYE